MFCLICGQGLSNGDQIIRLTLSKLVDLEKERFIYGTPSHLGEIHQRCFGDFDKKQLETEDLDYEEATSVERTNILSFLDG